MKTVLQEIFDVLDDRKDEMIALRRNFHQHPELSFHETETARKIAAFYDGKDCTVMTHVGGGNGILVDIQGGKPESILPSVQTLMHSDPRRNSVPFASTVPGVMHACGHDGHTAHMMILADTLI